MQTQRLTIRITVSFGEGSPTEIKIPVPKSEPEWKRVLRTDISTTAGQVAQTLYNKVFGGTDENQFFDNTCGVRMAALAQEITDSKLKPGNRITFARDCAKTVFSNEELPVPETTQRMALTDAFANELTRAGLKTD